MIPTIVGFVTNRSLLRRATLPLAAFGGVVVAGIVGFRVLAGVGTIEAAFGGHIHEQCRQMQTDRTIDGLEDHVVICGHGTFGRTIAARLRERRASS